jgi:hypothetical protein
MLNRYRHLKPPGEFITGQQVNFIHDELEAEIMKYIHMKCMLSIGFRVG